MSEDHHQDHHGHGYIGKNAGRKYDEVERLLYHQHKDKTDMCTDLRITFGKCLREHAGKGPLSFIWTFHTMEYGKCRNEFHDLDECKLQKVIEYGKRHAEIIAARK